MSDLLEQLTRETKAQRAPDHDWDAMEDSLQRAIEAKRPPRFSIDADPPARSWTPLAVAAGLVLAVGAAWYGTRDQGSVASTPPATEAPHSGSVDGDALPLGEVVSAQAGPVRVEHDGVGAWTLARSGAARLAAKGEFLTVALDQGAISAQVEKSQRPESFAIEVGELRVAVRGTEFRVVRRADSVLVDVTEGTVGVGPKSDRGNTTKWILEAPARGTFSLDAMKGRVIQKKQAEPVAAGEPEPEVAEDASPPKAAGGAAGTVLREAPPNEEVVQALDRLVAGTQGCFARNTSDGEVKVSAESNVTIQLSAAGKVEAVHFDPPLAPKVQGCVEQILPSVSVSRSRSGAKLSKRITLSR